MIHLPLFGEHTPDARRPVALHSAGGQNPFTDQPDSLPSNFNLRGDGLWATLIDKKGNVEYQRLSAPFRVSALCCRANGTNWARQVEFRDPAGQLHAPIFDESEFRFQPQKVLAKMVDHGFVVEASEQAQKSLKELLQVWRPARRLRLVDANGWADTQFTTFVLPDGRAIGAEEVTTRRTRASTEPTSVGSLENWRTEVAERCVGNPLLILAVSQAFVGPLLHPLDMGGGGFHLWGTSTCGKSTLLEAALSVWGPPSDHLSWRGIDNGLEAHAAMKSCTLLGLDEIGEALGARVVADAIYTLANGRPKQRMTSDGSAKDAARWHVAILSNGEMSVKDCLSSGGQNLHAGQEVRLIDLNTEGRRFGAFDVLHGETAAKAFAEAVASGVVQAYGHAGPAFVDALIPRLAEHARFRAMIDRFCKGAISRFDMSDNGPTQRMLFRFGLCALAGELASRWGITGWPPGTAIGAMMELLGVWVNEEDRTSRSDVASCLERTRSYLRTSALTCLTPIGTPPASGHDGWRDEETYYLLPEVWQRLHPGEHVEAARLHRAAGMLRCGEANTHQYRMGRKVPNRPRVYAVRARLLEEET